MAKDSLTYSINVNETIDNLLKCRYEEYIKKAEEEDVLTFEEFIFYIFKIGILSNEIKITEIERQDKKTEVGNLNSKLFHLTEEYDKNRKKLKYRKY